MRGALAAILACLVMILSPVEPNGAGALAAAPAPARLQIVSGPGFVLLVLPNDGGAAVEAAAGALGLRGAGPLSADTASRLAGLSGIIRTVRPRDDRLLLTLAEGIRAETYEVPGRLVVDLRPEASPPPAEARGAVPSPPASASRSASERRPASARRMPVPVPRPGISALAGDMLELDDTPELEAVPARSAPAAGPAPSAAPLPPSVVPPTAPRVVVSARATAETAELGFAWDRTVSAAAFERAGMLWLLFGTDAPQVTGWNDLGRADLSSWLAPAASEQDGNVHLFRLALRRPAGIRVERSGTVWHVRLMPAHVSSAPAGGAGPPRDVALDALSVAAPDGLQATISDPLTGERLGVLLTTAHELRQPDRLRLVDLELLATAQGLVWRPLADGVVASLQDGRFILSRSGGLRLAVGAKAHLAAELPRDDDPSEPAAGPLAPSVEPAPTSLLDLAALGGTDAHDRQTRRREIQARLAELSGPRRTEARLELVRLLLADGLGPEARGVLALVAAEQPPDPAVERHRAALAGAATALAGEPEAALTSLRDRELDGDPEAALWRLYAAARGGSWDRDARASARAGAMLERYPQPLRRLLGPVLATAMLDHDQADTALATIEPLRRLEPEPGTRAKLDLLAARALLDLGRPFQAAAPLRAAAADGDDATQAEAAFLAIRSGYEQGMLGAAAARDQLVAQRPHWDGHPRAARMLRYLAGLQWQAGDGLGAIASLRAALERAPDRVTAETVRDELRRRATELLQPESRSGLSPVAAVALYRSHRDLLAGDTLPAAVRLDLATRAAGAGLVETASALVAAAGPVTGPAAGRARLAVAEAEAGIGDTDTALRLLDGVPAQDRQTRDRIIRARAALDAADAKTALAALGEAATGDEADRVRRAALAALGDWQGLARTCEATLARQESGTVLEPARAEAVVWLALARARLGQANEAAELARRYTDRLPEDGPWRPLLALIAAPPLADTPERMAADAGTLAASLRTQLGLLPPLGDGEPKEVRTAPARSAPQG
ncbi:hypothetical protein [Benzoatithermus flavus]|uniref:Tetratricopeptide repeat-containing protein n=1 Tax=Benzoatithermus flavus TaxID=3108223 RepID=A0ABU8XW93_9PROT